jgi:hypothetical protein
MTAARTEEVELSLCLSQPHAMKTRVLWFTHFMQVIGQL